MRVDFSTRYHFENQNELLKEKACLKRGRCPRAPEIYRFLARITKKADWTRRRTTLEA
jgi:hypothetical protein